MPRQLWSWPLRLTVPTRLGNQHDPLHVLMAREFNAVASETTHNPLERGGRRSISAAFDIPDCLGRYAAMAFKIVP
jgi:hypothetical protein